MSKKKPSAIDNHGKSNEDTQSTTSNTENESLKEVMTIDLGVEVKGLLKKDEKGNIYVEGELNTPKWKQPSEVAVEIGELTEKVNGMPAGSIKYKSQLMPIGGGRLKAKIVLLAKESLAAARSVAKNVAKKFIENTTAQATLQFEKDSGECVLSEESDKSIKEGADKFLKAHGGKSLKTGMNLCVGGELIAAASGSWKTTPEDENSGDETKEIEGFYDGRRLRQRYFHIVEATKKAKVYEIYYDDNEYDTKFRELNDNKNAALSIKCKVVAMGRKTRLVLMKLEVIAM